MFFKENHIFFRFSRYIFKLSKFHISSNNFGCFSLKNSRNCSKNSLSQKYSFLSFSLNLEKSFRDSSIFEFAIFDNVFDQLTSSCLFSSNQRSFILFFFAFVVFAIFDKTKIKNISLHIIMISLLNAKKLKKTINDFLLKALSQ
jgi:hypothetical protein